MAKTLEPADKSFIEIFGFACGASCVARRPVESECISLFSTADKTDKNHRDRDEFFLLQVHVLQDPGQITTPLRGHIVTDEDW